MALLGSIEGMGQQLARVRLRRPAVSDALAVPEQVRDGPCWRHIAANAHSRIDFVRRQRSRLDIHLAQEFSQQMIEPAERVTKGLVIGGVLEPPELVESHPVVGRRAARRTLGLCGCPTAAYGSLEP